MANASIAINCLKSFQISGDFSTKVSLESHLALGNGLHQLINLLFRNVTRLHGRVDSRRFE
jgi:hypothetical protein